MLKFNYIFTVNFTVKKYKKQEESSGKFWKVLESVFD